MTAAKIIAMISLNQGVDIQYQSDYEVWYTITLDAAGNYHLKTMNPDLQDKTMNVVGVMAFIEGLLKDKECGFNDRLHMVTIS